MIHRTRGSAARLHPDLVRLVRVAACFRITMVYLLVSAIIIVAIAMMTA
jgi:hypothetical protein